MFLKENLKNIFQNYKRCPRQREPRPRFAFHDSKLR